MVEDIPWFDVVDINYCQHTFKVYSNRLFWEPFLDSDPLITLDYNNIKFIGCRVLEIDRILTPGFKASTGRFVYQYIEYKKIERVERFSLRR